MKKVVLSFVFFLAAIIVFGQQSVIGTFLKQRITYGINVGSGVTYLAGTNSGLAVSTVPKAAITGGVSADLRIWKSFYFQAELNYQNIGGGKEGNIVVTVPLGGYDKYNFQYLGVPMLLKFKIPGTGVGFYGGFQYAYLLSGNVKTGATAPTGPTGGQQESNTTYTVTKYLRNGDFSEVAGIEYFYHLKRGGQLGFSARYQGSVPTIDDDGNSATTLKNKVFLLTLGYRF